MEDAGAVQQRRLLAAFVLGGKGLRFDKFLDKIQNVNVTIKGWLKAESLD